MMQNFCIRLKKRVKPKPQQKVTWIMSDQAHFASQLKLFFVHRNGQQRWPIRAEKRGNKPAKLPDFFFQNGDNCGSGFISLRPEININ
jgi:hypothetical protein